MCVALRFNSEFALLSRTRLFSVSVWKMTHGQGPRWSTMSATCHVHYGGSYLP